MHPYINARLVCTALLAAIALACAGCALVRNEYETTKAAFQGDPRVLTQQVMLSGRHEVPPVSTAASGTGEISVGVDRSVRGSVRVNGMEPSAAHLHQGAAGVQGAVIVPMVRQSDGTFAFAPDATLTPEQYAAFRIGNTYINVHSAANPMGEIRSDQLKGPSNRTFNKQEEKS